MLEPTAAPKMTIDSNQIDLCREDNKK